VLLEAAKLLLVYFSERFILKLSNFICSKIAVQLNNNDQICLSLSKPLPPAL